MIEVGVEPRDEGQQPRKPARWFSRRRVVWIILLFSFGPYAQTGFWRQPSGGDRANWDYMAQVIARGGVPYRDAVNIKTPLSAYIGAAAILTAKPFGVEQLLAIRIVFIFLAAATVAMTFLVAYNYFVKLSVALCAAAVMLSWGSFLRLNGGGVQPKTPMILFGLMALWAIIKDRPLLAGLCGMLSALSWQPGLLFVGIAGLSFSRYLTCWRDKKVARLVLGAAIPLALALGYFGAEGALRDFYHWNFRFDLTVYAPGQARTLSGFFEHLAKVVRGFYRGSTAYFYLAIAGLLLAAGAEVRKSFRNGRSYLKGAAPRHAVIIAPLVYFGFCMIDMQSGPDLIPLLPFVAVFAALAMIRLTQALGRGLERLPGTRRRRFEAMSAALIVGVVLLESASGLMSIEPDLPSLNDQRAMVAEITSLLGPDDTIFVHGRTEVLVLSGLTNASRHFYLDRGKDTYLDQVEPGGFDGWLARLKAQRPKIVVLDRLVQMRRASDLESWVQRDYTARRSGSFYYHVRNDPAP